MCLINNDTVKTKLFKGQRGILCFAAALNQLVKPCFKPLFLTLKVFD